jgi:hypothetical protein
VLQHVEVGHVVRPPHHVLFLQCQVPSVPTWRSLYASAENS